MRNSGARCLAAACMVFLASNPVRADVDLKSGNGLQSECSTTEGISYGYCVGFVNGTITESRAMSTSYGKPQSFCLPDGVTYAQIVQVVRLYMTQHPEKLQNPANDLVFGAVVKAFPCPPKN